MRILYDNIIFSLQRAGGISVYWMELCKRLMSEGSNQLLFFERKDATSNFFRQTFDIPSAVIRREQSHMLEATRYLPIKTSLSGFDIFHSSYYRNPILKSCPVVTTVHDFIYEYYVTGMRLWMHKTQKAASIKRADGIICISENTKRDLLKFYPQVRSRDIVVIYNGIDKCFRQIGEAGIGLLDKRIGARPYEYYLFVGSRAKYKNFDLAVATVARHEHKSLMIVGGGELSEPDRQLLEKELPGRYVKLDYIDNETLNILYNYSAALLYPSSYEGFGIPVIEAMAAGCPVLAMDCSSLGEVSGGAALLCTDGDTAGFINNDKLLYEPSVREALTEKGLLNAQRFNWDDCFKKTHEFYQYFK